MEFVAKLLIGFTLMTHAAIGLDFGVSWKHDECEINSHAMKLCTGKFTFLSNFDTCYRFMINADDDVF